MATLVLPLWISWISWISSIASIASIASMASMASIASIASMLLVVPLQSQAAPKQAVVETSAGSFVVDLAPTEAPNQVAYFVKQAEAGAYDGKIGRAHV